MGLLHNLLHGKAVLNSLDSSDMLLEINGELRQKIQSDLLAMYLDVYHVCQKYQLTPFLVGGSVLGAVRHHGFIPWDDDLDIGMTRKDYTVFQKIFAQEFGDRYRLNAPNYKGKAKTRFPKIIKKGTTFRELVDSLNPEDCGLFLDIFILENVPDNKLVRKLKGIVCNGLEFIAGQVCFCECRTAQVKKLYLRAGKGNYYFRILIGKLFSFKRGWQWNNLVDRWVRCDDDHSKYCVFPTGRKHYFGEMLLRKKLFPAKMATFAGQQVPVFQDVGYYLKNLYGDYMQIPPLEKRERHFVVECKL